MGRWQTVEVQRCMFVFSMCCVCVYVKAAVSAEGEEVAVSEEIGQEEEKETRWQQAIEAQRRYVSIGMCMLVCRGSGERGRSKIAGVAMVRATAWSGGDGGQGRGRGGCLASARSHLSDN